MQFRPLCTLAAAGILLCIAPTSSHAAPNLVRSTRAGFELPGGAHDRGSRRTGFAQPLKTPTSHLKSIEAELGPVFASWDRDTGVPNRILPRGVVVPDAVADPTVAAEFARNFLARHIDALAPGSSVDDFMLVTNDLSNGIRSVGFVQRYRGMRVVGGQLSFRFKNDTLSVVASEAMPHVALPVGISAAAAPDTRVASPEVQSRSRQWVEADGLGHATVLRAVEGPFVLPVVRDSGTIRYHAAMRTVVETEAPVDRYEVFVDARTGEPLARRSLLFHATAPVLYNVPIRGPLEPRADYAATGAEVLQNDQVLLTSPSGVVEFAGPTAPLTLTVQGPLVAVSNASGDDATLPVNATDGSPVVWTDLDEQVDAQLASFVHAQLVKDYVRDIAPDFDFLDQQLPVTVNIDDTCNAFSDGFSINFFLSSDSCENTGRLSDVVYHEFGHSSHSQSLLAGVGFFDVALSEGISDYLSATITEDPGIGRGFFYDETPLRNLNPDGFEYRWPEDRGEVHAEGRIIGGALWDLRTALIGKYGRDEGIRRTDEIWFEATRRASNIPTMYVETLLVDDDDGDLANGTPNVCEINAAYGAHGLFDPGEGAEKVTLVDVGSTLDVQLQLQVPSFPDCPVSAAPTMQWQLRDDPSQNGDVVMSSDGEGGWAGSIPRFENEVIQYRIATNYSTGTERSLPDNYVDPWYETYVGDVVPLYCLGEDPAGAAWTFSGTGSNWAISGIFEDDDAHDPSAEFDGDGIWIGQDLSYGPNGSSSATITVDNPGFAEVRLQYWRWLTVEDGFFDRARITADGTAVWSSAASADEEIATFHHLDREWRFHDVDVSAAAADGAVEIGFELASDGGLEFGGWTLDGVCVVGVGAPSTCGDGVLESFEECDDGNLFDGDGCSSACTIEDDGVGGTGGGDTDGFPPGATDGLPIPEDTDGAGQDFDGDGLLGRGCACTSGGTGGSPFLLWIAVSGFALRRRRRT